MPDRALDVLLHAQIELRHLHGQDELAACFPVISELRPAIKNVDEWVARASDMQVDGYRILGAWINGTVLAMAGYRTTENLALGRFVHVDDLVTLSSHRNKGLGSALLIELSRIGSEEWCRHLALENTATHANAGEFFQRKGLVDTAVCFVKTLEEIR